MKSKNCHFYPKKRRGLSSVVGALLFVVLMVATFSVLGVALNTQTDIVSTARDVSDTDLKKQQEDFVIDNVLQAPGEPLQVNATNLGQNAVEIFTMILTNSTDTAGGFPTATIEIPSDTSFLAPGHNKPPTDVVKTLNLKLDITPDGISETYTIKLISSLGTIKKLEIICNDTFCGTGGGTGTSGIVAQLFLDGPTGVNTKTSTVVMFVTNTGELPLTDVAPNFGNPTPDCDDMWTSNVTNAVSPCNFDSLSPVDLAPSQTWMFKWDGRISGAIGDIFLFCNTATGTLPDTSTITTILDCDDLEVIDPNDCGGCGEGGETIILIDDLLIKPSIFMTIPSPFGDATDADLAKGLWGVNVANPTDQDMTISKVTIVAFPPGGNANDIVFSGAKSGPKRCFEEDIKPLTGPPPEGDWVCPRDNSVMWQNFTVPLLLPANSTKSFMLLVSPGDIFVSNQNLDALIVQANVYSTFGSFGKAGYQSTMYERDSPIVNVYLSDAADLRTGFIGNVNDIANYTSGITFNAVLADMDDNPLTFINAGAKFIINVPREWTFEGFISCDGFDDVEDGDCDLTDSNFPSVTLHSDGSTQIIGTSTNIIGDGTTADFTDPSEAKKISFTVRSAPVEFPRLYIMYILADGIVSTPDGDRTIGPLAEVVLNVDP